jgi:hypothetical protein
MIYISLLLEWIVTAEETDAAVEAMKISLGYCRYFIAMAESLARLLWNSFLLKTGI